MNEGPLHAALKSWYARPGDRFEVPLLGRQIDLVCGDLLIEIQTRGLGALRAKLGQLLDSHDVLVVHPVPLETWIVRVDDDGRTLGRRRSPRRGRLTDVFEELVALPKLLAHPRLTVEIALTREEEVRRREPGRAWRRKGWVVIERRLIEVVEQHRIEDPRDLIGLLPAELPEPFDTAELAHHMGVPRELAQKVAYCLREAGVIFREGKRGNALLYGIPP